MSQFKNFFDHHTVDVKTPISEAPILTLGAISESPKPRSCRVAILVGDGVDSDSVKAIYSQLSAYGAAPRLVGCGRGSTANSDEIALGIDASLGAAHAMLYDAVVVIADENLARQFAQDTHIFNFVRQQYHCCKPILAVGAAAGALAKFDIPAFLPSGLPDPAVVVETGCQLKKALLRFKHLLPLTPSLRIAKTNNN